MWNLSVSLFFQSGSGGITQSPSIVLSHVREAQIRCGISRRSNSRCTAGSNFWGVVAVIFDPLIFGVSSRILPRSQLLCETYQLQNGGRRIQLQNWRSRLKKLALQLWESQPPPPVVLGGSDHHASETII